MPPFQIVRYKTAPLTFLLLYLLSFCYRGDPLLLQIEDISLYNERASRFVASRVMNAVTDPLV